MAKKKTTRLPDFVVDTWGGLNTAIKSAKDIEIGTSPDSNNWITGYDAIKKKGDHIELRRGQVLLGNSRNLENGFVSGLGIGIQENGTQIPFWTYGNNLQYFNVVSGANVSISTLPVAGANDWISIERLNSIAGSFIYISSPNTSLYKIPVSDPTGIIDINNGEPPTGVIQGNLNFSNSRMNLWNKNGNTQAARDAIDLFQSEPDFSTYSALAGIAVSTGPGDTVGTGDGSTKIFGATLSKVPVAQPLIAGAIGTGFTITAITAATQSLVTTSSNTGFTPGQYILIEGVVGTMGTALNGHICQVVQGGGEAFSINVDTTSLVYSSGGSAYATEYFTDDQNGDLVSNLGGAGTINYGTGAVSVTFNTAPLNAIVIQAQYYYQAPYTGVEDFVPDEGAGAGTAYIFPQRDGGGSLNAVQPFQGQLYCFHAYRTWVATTDPNAAAATTNIPFRNNIGTPFYNSAYPTGDGIVFLDNSTPAHPKFQVLSIAPNSTTDTVEPFDLAEMLDLSQYAFNAPVVFFWNNYYILCCQNLVNGSAQDFNGTMFIMNIDSGFWDRLDYTVSQLVQYNGTLLSGDSISDNLFTLFSGFDDDGSLIDNYWKSGVYNLDFEGLKKTERFEIEGLIQPAQMLDIYVSYDQGPFTLVQTINGTDACVSQGDPQLVGSDTVGSTVVGAGNITANPFLLDFQLASDVYNYIQVKFVAAGIGYIEIDRFALKYNNMKSIHVLPANTLN